MVRLTGLLILYRKHFLNPGLQSAVYSPTLQPPLNPSGRPDTMLALVIRRQVGYKLGCFPGYQGGWSHFTDKETEVWN